MDVNLKNYKQFLYDTLLADETNGVATRLTFAKTISASVPMYLGRQADLNNESEKEIYQYARQLMNDVLTEKITYQQFHHIHQIFQSCNYYLQMRQSVPSELYK